MPTRQDMSNNAGRVNVLKGKEATSAHEDTGNTQALETEEISKVKNIPHSPPNILDNSAVKHFQYTV